jgi:hypothetical protein
MGNEHSSTILADETFGEDGHFKVHLKLHEGLTPSERLKLSEACEAWVEVWQSSQFKNWLLTYDFSDPDHSNQVIYEKLLGSMSKANVVTKTADIEIWGKREGAADITTISTTFVSELGGENWEGTPYLTTYPAPKLAGFLAYDFCRFLGFRHAGSGPTHTVPFAVAKETKRLAELNAPITFPVAKSVSTEVYEADVKDELIM